MPTYAAVLGHQPHLSLAELRAVFPDFTPKGTVGPVALFETSASFDPRALHHLGGTVALAEEITPQPSLEALVPTLVRELTGTRGKITFSIRAYGVKPAIIRELYRKGKDELRKQGRPSRYIGNERRPAAAVLIHQEELLTGKGGRELFLINLTTDPKSEDMDLWAGRTIFVQDIDEYTLRDVRKPVRDTRSGLLPPKLAQILLNFGEWLLGKPPSLVYDPFSGTGVIPMECLLRGWPVLASDLSLKAVNGSEKNLEWLRKEKDILKRDVPSAVWKQDARKPFDFSDAKRAGIREAPDLIVTETSLGKAFESRPSIKEAMKERTASEALEAEFLENVAAQLPGVPVVMTWPVWFHSKGNVMLERIWDRLHALGFYATLPPGVDPELPGRLSLLYRRSGQYVGREIVMLRRKK
jgi:hypothetical protein